MPPPDWMPDLIPFHDYRGDWHAYYEAIKKAFWEDFVESRPRYAAGQIRLKWWPENKGYEDRRLATLWHFISEGEVEDERLVNFERSERIKWPKSVIENSEVPEVKSWRERRNGELRVHLWCEDAEYLVVLGIRSGYFIPWTGYPVTREHQRKKLNRRWMRYGQPK